MLHATNYIFIELNYNYFEWGGGVVHTGIIVAYTQVHNIISLVDNPVFYNIPS